LLFLPSIDDLAEFLLENETKAKMKAYESRKLETYRERQRAILEATISYRSLKINGESGRKGKTERGDIGAIVVHPVVSAGLHSRMNAAHDAAN